MRILFDECVPRPLKRELTDYEIRTVAEMGWSGKKNGELLQLMQAREFYNFTDHRSEFTICGCYHPLNVQRQLFYSIARLFKCKAGLHTRHSRYKAKSDVWARKKANQK